MCPENWYEWIFKYICSIWTRLAPVFCFYNLNSIFDHCYLQHIHEQSVISREIKQKHCRNMFVSCKLVQMNIWIYSYQNLATNEYPNIFVSKKLTRTNIWIYSYSKNYTNEYPNKSSDQKYLNIQIIKYICHTLPNNGAILFLSSPPPTVPPLQNTNFFVGIISPKKYGQGAKPSTHPHSLTAVVGSQKVVFWMQTALGHGHIKSSL